MVDPTRITNFNLTPHRLEEVLLFWICAAGKNAKSAANGLETFLSKIKCQSRKRPFYDIRHFAAYPRRVQSIANYLKWSGVGCYNQKGNTFWELAHSGLNLRTCSVDDLEQIKGIGMKTSRCFIMHSRKDVNCAGLDTHILRFLRDNGIDSPKQTPTRKRYLELEQEFLKLAKKARKHPAVYDLEIWNEYSGHNK